MNECLGGDWLDVEVGFSRMGNSSLTGGFLMTSRRTGEAAAKGSFTYVFVDKATRKSCPIPEDFKATILARQPELA
jgi:acyl-CoA thioester hydrolase